MGFILIENFPHVWTHKATQIQHGTTNLFFAVDEEFLYNDTSAIMIEIYALHWFKDIHVGTVRVLVGTSFLRPLDLFTMTVLLLVFDLSLFRSVVLPVGLRGFSISALPFSIVR